LDDFGSEDAFSSGGSRYGQSFALSKVSVLILWPPCPGAFSKLLVFRFVSCPFFHFLSGSLFCFDGKCLEASLTLNPFFPSGLFLSFFPFLGEHFCTFQSGGFLEAVPLLTTLPLLCAGFFRFYSLFLLLTFESPWIVPFSGFSADFWPRQLLGLL